jgi:hypothetical protein
MHHRRQRRNLVGGDVVAQRPCAGERECRTRELPAYPVSVLAQVENRRAKAEGGRHRLDAGRGADNRERPCPTRDPARHCSSMPAFFTSFAYLAISERKN